MALQVAERVIDALRPPVTVKGIAHTVTASIGITYAVLGAGGRTAELTADDVLHEADAAMYVAKGRGKNRFELFEQQQAVELPHRRSVDGPAVRR
jgi:GGDEF domain-containing protein